jgi:hypothetical protein
MATILTLPHLKPPGANPRGGCEASIVAPPWIGRVRRIARRRCCTKATAGSTRFTPDASAANQALIELLQSIAEKKQATVAQVALASLTAHKP